MSRCTCGETVDYCQYPECGMESPAMTPPEETPDATEATMTTTQTADATRVKLNQILCLFEGERRDKQS